MNYLHRELAPISDVAWRAIDGEARRSILHFIAGRNLFTLDGPHGYTASAITMGRLGQPRELEGASAAIVGVQPLVELRAGFAVSRDDLDVLDRGGDIAFDSVVDAARRISAAEDRLVFDGHEGTGIEGCAAAAPYESVPLAAEYDRFPRAVATAVTELRSAGVGGPYGIALGPREHRGVIESSEQGGYPVLQHLHLILGGPVVWAPTIDGAVVVSMRGGDFEIYSGLDFAVRYIGHDRDRVDLEVIETVTFRNLSPEAAITIR